VMIFIMYLNKKYLYSILGVLLLLLSWQIISVFSHPLIVPSPLVTIKALINMATSGELLKAFSISIQRQLTGLAIGVMCGIVLGILGGLKAPINNMITPMVNTVLAVPAVIFVVIAMVWFGQGTVQVVFVVALLVFPVMYINCEKGIESIDPNLIKMAIVYKVPLKIRIMKVYLPGLTHGIMTGFALSVASSIRLTVMSELFGAQDGIGQAIAMTRFYLETDKLFAWALILVFIVATLDKIIFKPLELKIERWKS
jgi:NitT/TauT family transport system permease protein